MDCDHPHYYTNFPDLPPDLIYQCLICIFLRESPRMKRRFSKQDKDFMFTNVLVISI